MKAFIDNIVVNWRVLVAGVVGLFVERFGLPQATVDGVIAIYTFLFG